jgi:hypothetical protein
MTDNLLKSPESELRDAFMAGFFVSGEGWNGEWPFGSTTVSDRMVEYEESLEDAWHSYRDSLKSTERNEER